MSTTIVVLAGGLGTRLGAITASMPKAMVDVGGKPFIHHKLVQIRESGLRNVVLSVGHYWQQISDYVKGGDQWGLRVSYALDPFPQCGTGRAIQQILVEQLPSIERLFVTYGDSLSFIDPEDLAQKLDLDLSHDACISAIHADLVPNNKPNCGLDATGSPFYVDPSLENNGEHAPTHVEYGLALINAVTFRSGQESKLVFGFDEWLHLCSKRGRLALVETLTPFQEVGTFDALEKTRKWVHDG